jgi:translation initiation factor 6 (eIF-6)
MSVMAIRATRIAAAFEDFFPVKYTTGTANEGKSNVNKSVF